MKTLTPKELEQLNLYFDATNYLAVGQLYLLDNPLLKRELTLKDIKPRLVGHWGTIPGQNFIFTHLNRVITRYNLNMIYLVGPGHGGQPAITNAYLDGTYTEIYPTITKDEEGLKKLFKQFSFPGGVSSHVAPETPGSIHEGGELGYSLIHGFGAVLDNPDLIAACIVGDGEAETGPLATSWHVNKFINPLTDGVVLPILHLNGFKISNPTVLSRMSESDLKSYFSGLGWIPYFVEGSDIDLMQELMATTLDEVITKIKSIKDKAIYSNDFSNIKWPMIVLRTPKGWTGPKEVEGSFKAHQVPLTIDETCPENIEKLREWLNSYHPEKIFDENGHVLDSITSFLPRGNQRMSANPIVNGGKLLKDLKTPNIKEYMLTANNGSIIAKDMYELGNYLRDVIKMNEDNHNFRIFSPDEAMSNRLNHMFEATNRQWILKTTDKDEFLAPYGRVLDSYLSEHFAEGALEGYLLTGRHGLIHSYEAFLRVIDSMVGIHAKWLKMTKEIPWRADISSLNIIATSHIWQQDHNGYTHQEPGFINHLLTKKRDITNVYLPYDANSLIYITDKVLHSKNQINLIIASKHERPQWLNYEKMLDHCSKGIGIWEFASDANPEIILACAGDTPTLEVMAATQILKEKSNIRVRVVNVVDLLTLERLDDAEEFERIFPSATPVIFAFHGYPGIIKELLYNRHRNFYIYGYEEEGAITTPFDMRVLNNIDRYHIIINAIKILDSSNKELRDYCVSKLMEHYELIRDTGEDLIEVTDFKWKDAE